MPIVPAVAPAPVPAAILSDELPDRPLHEVLDELAAAILIRLYALPAEFHNAATAARLEFFAARWLKIRTKAGGPVAPFAMNEIQLDFLRDLRQRDRARGVANLDRFRGIRRNVMKARQFGFSTFIAALYFVDGFLCPGRNTVVVTHLAKISVELLRTYRLFWNVLPDEVKDGLALGTAASNEFEIRFPGEEMTPSRFLVWTERGEDYRGGVIHNLHGSESAFYRDYLSWKTSFFQAVDQTEGNIILETTANGMNSYYDDVQLSLRGKSSFALVFYPWHRLKTYVRPWVEAEQDPITPDERAHMALHGWSLEQLAWRRWKMGELTSVDRFKQEFPSTIDEAFLMSGRPFFPMDRVKAELEVVWKQVEDGTLAPSNPLPGVLIWEDPIPGDLYALAADVAEGEDAGAEVAGDPARGGSDYSAAYVVHAKTMRVVAAIHGRIPIADYARLISWLGRRYQACVIPERNNHGHTVVHILQESGYPWLYRHLDYDVSIRQTYLKAGFPTTGETRPQILDALYANIQAGRLWCPDPALWRECSTFHWAKGKAKAEAMEGYHDDRVMALAIAVYCLTLGRSAWGAPDGSWADPSGLPVLESATVPALPPTPALPPLQEVVVDPATPPVLAAVDQMAAKARANTCGSCASCTDGLCGDTDVTRGRRVRVGEDDPGCWAWSARLNAPEDVILGGGWG